MRIILTCIATIILALPAFGQGEFPFVADDATIARLRGRETEPQPGRRLSTFEAAGLDTWQALALFLTTRLADDLRYGLRSGRGQLVSADVSRDGLRVSWQKDVGGRTAVLRVPNGPVWTVHDGAWTGGKVTPGDCAAALTALHDRGWRFPRLDIVVADTTAAARVHAFRARVPFVSRMLVGVADDGRPDVQAIIITPNTK